jgi:hypothetical protein
MRKESNKQFRKVFLIAYGHHTAEINRPSWFSIKPCSKSQADHPQASYGAKWKPFGIGSHEGVFSITADQSRASNSAKWTPLMEVLGNRFPMKLCAHPRLTNPSPS